MVRVADKVAAGMLRGDEQAAMPGGIAALASVLPRTTWRRARTTGVGAVLPACVLLFLFFAVPVLALLLRSVLEPRPGLQNYAALLASTTYLRVFSNTFVVAGLVTVVTVTLGLPLAWFLVVAPRFWSRLVFGIVILSMWTNLLARTYAWMVLLQSTGLINRTLIALGLIRAPLPLIYNLVGVTIGMTYIMLPFMVIPLQSTIASLDHATFQAASLCGATRWQSFRRVFLPLILPGLAAGGLMVFVMSLGYYITPALLGGTSNMMLAQLIAQLVQSLLNWGLAAAAAFVLLAITLTLYAAQVRLLGVGRMTT